MGANSLRNTMLNIIDDMPIGKPFAISDFVHIAEYSTIKQNLKRFTDENIIKRIIPGIYYRPKYSKLLNEFTAVDIGEVAEAMARNYNWSIVPSGDTALNMLGLSTQVPAKYEYVSSGPYHEYEIDGITLKFMHRTPKQLSDFSMMTALTVQALKALGKDNVTEVHINALKHRLKEDEKKKLLEEGKRTTHWVYSCIKKICKEN